MNQVGEAIERLWEQHKEICITESLNFFIIGCGFAFLWVGLDSGSQLISLFPNNPAILQIVGVITGVGITTIFFGVGNVYTYYKDYQSGRDTENIKTSIAGIKQTVVPLNMQHLAIMLNDISKKQDELSMKLEEIDHKIPRHNFCLSSRFRSR
jgi:hypothetical protein